MQHLTDILQGLYDELENKEVFLPLVISNSIICYKLSHDSEEYWESFSQQSCTYTINNIKDIYLFFIDYLPKTSHFEGSYKRKMDHLKEFDVFLKEFFHMQKFYFKNFDTFEKHLNRCIKGIPNPKVLKFCREIFEISSKIRFEK